MNTTNITTAGALLAAAGATHAHEVHGLAGAHWHATDSVGLLLVGVLTVLVVWLSRRGDSP